MREPVKLKKESYQAKLMLRTLKQADRYWKAKQSAALAVAEKIIVWEEFSEAMESDSDLFTETSGKLSGSLSVESIA